MPAAGFGFDLPPAGALKFFRAKGLKTSFAWADMLRAEHDADFTVAKMLDLDLLADVRAAVDQGIAQGWTSKQFIANLKPELVKRGWWGKAEMRDPLTGESKLVELGSPRRLRVIFNTNLKTAYAAGQWAHIQDHKAAAPYLLYDAVNDARTRPEHHAWDNTVLPADSPWWRTHYPPNGWNCRCTVVQLSARQLARLGKAGPDKPPPANTREWVNPRTGELEQVPVGIDPGWNYNPGASRVEHLLEVATGKLDAAAPPLATATIQGLVESPAFEDFLRAPKGVFPIARLPREDAALIGAGEQPSVGLSAATAAKQAANHPEIEPGQYLYVQTAIDRGRRIQDTEKSLVYVLEAEGYVTVVKATVSGKAIFLNSLRRLSSEAAKRASEIRRLLRKAKSREGK